MIEPSIRVESLQAGTDQWVDLTCDVTGIRYTRGKVTGGKQAILSPVEAGVMTVTLDNSSGVYTYFSPGTSDGQAPIAVLNEGTTVRVVADDLVLFTGDVETWRETWTTDIATIELTAVDAVARMNEQGGYLSWTPATVNEGAQPGGSTVRNRLLSLLGRAGVVGSQLHAMPGFVTLINPIVTQQSVLAEISATALSDGGVFFHEPISPAPALPPFDRFVYLDRTRLDGIPEVEGLSMPAQAVPTTGRAITGPAGTAAPPRAAQGPIPTFSDDCPPGIGENLPYTGIEWEYVGYDRPSLVVVANTPPPEERDNAGNLLPPKWTAAAAQVPALGQRHRVTEITDLRFSTNDQASQLATFYAQVLSESTLDVTQLDVYPHLDDRLWEVVLGLRLYDHLRVVRHLRHSTIIADAAVEGFTVRLRPEPRRRKDGKHFAEWRIEYRLSPLLTEVVDIPGSLPPVGPPQPGAIPITVAWTLNGTTVTATAVDQQTPFPPHRLIAIHPLYGTVEVPLTASTGTGPDFVLTGTLAGLPPGDWDVYVQDIANPSRISTTAQMVTVPQQAPQNLRFLRVAVGTNYLTDPSSRIGLVGWDPVVGATAYTVRAVRDNGETRTWTTAGTTFPTELELDSTWEVTVAAVGGPWSAPARVRMGHPARDEVYDWNKDTWNTLPIDPQYRVDPHVWSVGTARDQFLGLNLPDPRAMFSIPAAVPDQYLYPFYGYLIESIQYDLIALGGVSSFISSNRDMLSIQPWADRYPNEVAFSARYFGDPAWKGYQRVETVAVNIHRNGPAEPGRVGWQPTGSGWSLDGLSGVRLAGNVWMSGKLRVFVDEQLHEVLP